MKYQKGDSFIKIKNWDGDDAIKIGFITTILMVQSGGGKYPYLISHSGNHNWYADDKFFDTYFQPTQITNWEEFIKNG